MDDEVTPKKGRFRLWLQSLGSNKRKKQVLTKEEIVVIQSSWFRLQHNCKLKSANFPVLLFGALSIETEHMQAIFDFHFPDKQILFTHAAKVIDELNNIIYNLNEKTVIDKFCKRVGIAHAKTFIRPSNFTEFENVFFRTVITIMGDDIDRSFKKAWKKFFLYLWKSIASYMEV